MSGALLSLGAALVAVAAAQVAPVSVEEILANPDRFDGQMVTIEGTMIDLKRRVTRLGDPFYKFYLSEGKLAIRVISLGSPPCLSGAVTVEGTFAKIKRGRLSVSYNVVSASRVICRQEKSKDDEPGAGRGTWVLWSKVYIMQNGEIADHFYSAEAFTSKPECENAARRYKENYKDASAGKADFKCFPDTVDPRGPKGK